MVFSLMKLTAFTAGCFRDAGTRAFLYCAVLRQEWLWHNRAGTANQPLTSGVASLCMSRGYGFSPAHSQMPTKYDCDAVAAAPPKGQAEAPGQKQGLRAEASERVQCQPPAATARTSIAAIMM